MKKYLTIAAVILGVTAAHAEAPATFTCAYQNGDMFTVVGSGGVTLIQWGNNPFHDAKSEWNEPFLYVSETAEHGTFAMRWNVKTGEADGWTKFDNGETRGGPLFCRFK